MPIRAPKGFIDETDPKVCQIGHPAPPWLVNYADLMTELVCFFVVLYALSAALNKNMQNAKAEVEKMMKEGEIKNVEVKMDKEGLHISLEEEGQVPSFQSGSADTTAAMEAKVGLLADKVLRKLSDTQDIIVEGHTDNQRMHNEYYDSNWELSTARATSVARLLIDRYQLPASRIGAIGYGEFRPLVPNDNPEHRAKNRRVVFFIKNSSSAPAGAPKASATPAKEAAAPVPAAAPAEPPASAPAAGENP